MMKEIFTIARPLNVGMIRQRNVGSLGVQRIGFGVVQLVRDEGQRIFVKAFLCRNLSGSNGTRLDLEVSLVMRREDALDLDNTGFFVASLERRREDTFSDGIGRVIVIVIPHFAATGFGASDVEALGTSLGGGVICGTAPPDGINAGVVVPRAGRFEIPVGIGAAKCKLGGQHRGDRFCACGQDHLLG